MGTKDIQKDKIAVILSVYRNDSVTYLRECINSLLQQTISSFILIGVDGPVSEELTNCLTEFNEKDNIRILYFNENRGLAAVLNDLIDVCKTEGFDYYARMDADDIAAKDRMAIQANFLKSHPDVDVVGGAIEEIDGKSELRGKKVSYPLTHEKCREFYGYRNPMAHPAVMFRKSFFEKVKGYRSEYRKNQDTMIWLDGFLNGCTFANVPDTVLYFRMDESLLKGRRHGWNYAMDRLKNRIMVNHKMGYGLKPFLYAIAMFCIRISPVWMIKLAYKFR